MPTFSYLMGYMSMQRVVDVLLINYKMFRKLTTWGLLLTAVDSRSLSQRCRLS
jgi:hypothetical protein